MSRPAQYLSTYYFESVVCVGDPWISPSSGGWRTTRLRVRPSTVSHELKLSIKENCLSIRLESKFVHKLTGLMFLVLPPQYFIQVNKPSQLLVFTNVEECNKC